MRIGFTERGDAGLDLSWFDKCKAGKVDGLIAITKALTPLCAQKLLELHKSGFPTILHCGCTGWGGTYMEPNVPSPTKQLDALKNLVDAGFPVNHVVLRIDPIVPTAEGLKLVKRVLNGAAARGFLNSAFRVRISVIDEYRHVKDRYAELGVAPAYGPTNFSATDKQFRDVVEMLWPYHDLRGIVFETCAEERLSQVAKTALEFDKSSLLMRCGCVSRQDLDIMGLDYDKDFVNPQGRNGCLCLGCKVELLENKRRCPNQCLYCYWRD